MKTRTQTLASALVGLVVASGCMDFTAAREACAAKGACETPAQVTLASTTPGANATGVTVDTDIGLIFSEAMDRSSVKVTLAPAAQLQSSSWQEDGTDTTVSFSTAAALAYSTTYTVTVTGRASSGHELASPTQFSFTTGGAPDTTAPTATTVPASGATGVAVGAHLVIVFSEPVQPDSLQVDTQPAFDWGTASWSADGLTATFGAPPTALAPQTSYALTLSAADLAGNLLAAASRVVTFKTGDAPPTPDTTPPTVVATQPAPSSTGVSPSAIFSVTFSEKMQPGATSAIVVTPTVSCNWVWDVTGSMASCTHVSALAANTGYTVSVGSGAKDLAGNGLASTFSFGFTTSSVPDTTPPTIVSVTPANASKGVSQYTSIAVQFSEQMDKASAQSAFAISSPTGAAPTFAWSADGKTMTVYPGLSLNFAQVVSWQVSTAAKDLAGNGMAATQLYTFIVRYQSTATIAASATDITLLKFANGTLSNYAANDTILWAGDNGVKTAFRSVVQFDGTKLPHAPLSIDQATFRLHGYSTTNVGTPYISLGKLVVQRIEPGRPSGGVLPTTAYRATAIPYCYVLLLPGGGGSTVCPDTITVASVNFGANYKNTYVTDWADDSMRDGGTLSLRLQFETETNNDATADYVGFSSSESAYPPYLDVTYTWAGP